MVVGGKGADAQLRTHISKRSRKKWRGKENCKYNPPTPVARGTDSHIYHGSKNILKIR
jgi:hypothetical protein